jgi:hypothetical protein
MGGFGSGRGNSGQTAIVEDCLSIDACRWMREGIIRAGCHSSGVWRWTNSTTGERTASITYRVDACEVREAIAHLAYTVGTPGKQLDYAVRLQVTQPNYTGLRWWFTCPLVTGGRACKRRARKLYLPPGAIYFGCRNCYRLSYLSRNVDAKTGAIDRARKVRMKLGGGASLFDSFPPKPKGMWWRTYAGLAQRAERAEGDCLRNMRVMLGRLRSSTKKGPNT